MRILALLLLASAATAVLSAPSAGACHVIAAAPADAPSVLPDHYVVPTVGMDGCPHDVHLCVEVWRETGAEPGLQTTGENADDLIVLVCPYR